MAKRDVQFGDILLVNLPVHIPTGHEQQGLRPALIVGLPQKLGTPRYPVLLVAPLTTQRGNWSKRSPKLYPVIQAGVGGLNITSTVLLDHLRAVDQTRIVNYIGTLNHKDFRSIQKRIVRLFGG